MLAARPTVVVALLACAGYAVIGRAAGNLYPFSSFPMYAAPHAAAGSRVAVRDAAGRLHEVTAFALFDCDAPPGPPDLDATRCGPSPDFFHIPYLDRDLAEYVARHRGAAPAHAEPATLVRHVWSFPPRGAPPRERDCELYRCRVVRR